MEDYPEELRTPPVALACVVGCPELHALITAHLHSQQPPMNTIALPDFSKISVIAPQKTPSDNPEPVAGILKRDWLSKHRTRIPSVVAALFSSHDISGDPAQWLQVCTDLENLKATVRSRNIKLVVVVVVNQPGYKDGTSEDRMVALRKRAEVDTKNLIVFVPDDHLELKQSLSRLWNAFSESANIYYRDEGRRIKVRLEKKNFSSMELNVRYCFKVAVYAEFRRDWLEALRLYEDAYHALREMVGTSTRLPPIQRLVEIKTVAEQLHFKMSTLLLHGGKVAEAIEWFRQHTANYRRLVGAPEVVFLHWEWLSRQYLVFGQLLETSSAIVLTVPSMVSVPTEKPSEWEFYPAYYYQWLLLRIHISGEPYPPFQPLISNLRVIGCASTDSLKFEMIICGNLPNLTLKAYYYMAVCTIPFTDPWKATILMTSEYPCTVNLCRSDQSECLRK